MTYNIHPIFVHFPIALLFLYSLIKILPFQKWFPKVSWKHIENAMLFVGVAGAFIALYTGSTASRLIHPNRQLVSIHSMFASIATLLYCLIVLGEILSYLIPVIIPKLNSPKFTNFLVFIQNILISPFVSKSLALLGLIAISLTGLLGGAMVYNTTADPMTGIILHMFGIVL